MKKGKMVKAQPMPDLNTEFSTVTLGSAIRSKRTDRGWRIDDLASKANLSRRTVMKVEKGDTSVTFANVLILMDILGLSLRLIDVNLFVRPHSQIPSQAENSVRSNEDGWYE
ncbi:helix-turn-helix domain-containing protein [Vibrio vulnificus]|nr:helix-turn-helix domain-containing protein [Vibrio vulnificus]MCU8169310.1 helix-turn-helix domain-containing protein [Vibrio vulnificus]